MIVHRSVLGSATHAHGSKHTLIHALVACAISSHLDLAPSFCGIAYTCKAAESDIYDLTRLVAFTLITRALWQEHW